MIKYLYSGGSFQLVSWNGLKIDQIFIRCSAFWTNNRMRIWFIVYIYFYSERKMSFDSRELQTACVLISIYWQTWRIPSQSSWLSAQLSFKSWKFRETSNKYATFHRPFNSEAIWSTSRHFPVSNMQIQKKSSCLCCLLSDNKRMSMRFNEYNDRQQSNYKSNDSLSQPEQDWKGWIENSLPNFLGAGLSYNWTISP